MNFTKFVSILNTSALYFARSDRLGDEFEGSVSRLTQSARLARFPDHQPGEVLARRAQITSHFRKAVMLSCWHRNEDEDLPMWKIYAKDGDGVAIKTDFTALTASFICDEIVYIGQVKYVDYLNERIPDDDAVLPYFHKRKPYENEREVRALTHLLPQQGGDVPDFYLKDYPPGVHVKVDVATLIKAIRVTPSADSWFFDLVSSVTAKYGLTISVSMSRFSGTPTW